MTNRYFPKYIALSLAALYGASAAVDTGTVSITAIPEWAIQASCVQGCLYQGPFGFAYPLAASLGCVVSTSTIYNGCFCTNVVSSKASAFIKQCVSIYCTGTAQIGGAISIYDNYCVDAGYPRTNAAASTTTTVTPGKPATTTQAGGVVYTFTAGDLTTTYTFPTSFATSTAGSSTGATTTTTTKKKVNIGAIVGGVVAGLVVLGALFLAFFMWMRKRNQKARANQLAAQQQQQMMQQQQMPFVPQQPPHPPGGPPQYIPTPAPQNPISYGNPSPVSPVSSFAVPATTPTPAPAVPPIVKEPVGGGGRAELGDPNATTLTPNVEVEANEHHLREVEANEARTNAASAGKYGSRPEEVDGSGRYVGELHGDGRGGAGHAELPGASHPWN